MEGLNGLDCILVPPFRFLAFGGAKDFRPIRPQRIDDGGDDSRST